MTETDVFKHATPSLYDKYMGPLLFEPFAKHVAERVRLVQPELILETAAGTGIVTRAVLNAVPGATIVATDINPAVVAFAAEQGTRSGSPFSRRTRRICLSAMRPSISSFVSSGRCPFQTKCARTQKQPECYGAEAATSWFRLTASI